MIRKSPLHVLAVLLSSAVLSCTASASADTITFSITNAKQSANPGTNVSFNATISAPVANSASYYLSYNANFNPNPPSSLAVVDNGFANNFFPFSFDPNTSLTALLFTVSLPTNLASGAYTGFFEVFDGNDFLSSNVKSTATFEIDVPAAASPVPEPGTWLLLATGLCAFTIFSLYKRHPSAFQQ